MKRSLRTIRVIAALAMVSGALLWRTVSTLELQQTGRLEHSDSDAQSSNSKAPELSLRHPESNIQNPAPSLNRAFVEQLETIVSSDAERFLQRHAAVHDLGDDLNEQEIQALYVFLLAPPPDGGLERRQDRALKNDLLNRLRSQKDTPDGLTNILVAMFNNADQDPVVRDYALQQMRAWQEAAPMDDYTVMEETLARALEETEGSIGGTALLALRQFDKDSNKSGADPGLPRSVLASATQSALSILHSKDAGELSRITAMQVAAERVPEEIVPLAAQWAQDTSSSYPKRISAISALGSSASEEVIAILARIEAQGDPYLQPALQTAYRKLRKAGTLR